MHFSHCLQQKEYACVWWSLKLKTDFFPQVLSPVNCCGDFYYTTVEVRKDRWGGGGSRYKSIHREEIKEVVRHDGQLS